ncbi:hypothetical protein [Apibacter adventoris]|uniref:hypothetical protein n=1 Tax=Apibacter adventoris TaxID=1679466 RepID=UPI000CF64A88|nr:hypothetical protein [Apibacter adventoris]PQL95208.1 hypothetical protein C4S76_03205 [Apibacter adventoris]
MISILTTTAKINKLYLMTTGFISMILSYLTSLKMALLAFAIITILDTITRINAEAKKQKLKFNPLKKYFYRQIKSKGLRLMCDKIFTEYGIYMIIAFVIDYFILDQMVLFNFNNRGLTLTIIALYIFSGIEIWSLGENIEDAGGINIIKKVLCLLPEKYQKIFNSEEVTQNKN